MAILAHMTKQIVITIIVTLFLVIGGLGFAFVYLDRTYFLILLFSLIAVGAILESLQKKK